MDAQTQAAEALVVSRTIKAPRERVFAAWTDPAAYPRWFGPESCKATNVQMDVREGGQYSLTCTNTEFGDVDLAGAYREVKAPEKLVYTWKWLTEPLSEAGESLVTVEFIAQGESTEIRITHEGLPAGEIQEKHSYGWNGSLDKLESYL